MKKNYLKIIGMLLIAGSSFSAMAQNEITTLFKSGVTDLDKMVEGYMKPMGTGFAANLGSNWFNTAAPHKLLGFDVTVGFGVAMAPTSDQTFSLLGFQNLKPSGGETTAPTYAGKGDGVTLNLMQPDKIKLPNGIEIANPEAGKAITSFQSPPGVLNWIPGISGQVALGLPFGTEVIVRYVPTVKAAGFDMGLWGFGIKHDFKQWIPVVSALPFDASILVGYTKFTLNYAFPLSAQITPSSLADPSMILDQSGLNYNNQKLGMSASALTANILISKKLLFFTPYLGFGFTKSSFNLGFKGNYPILGDPYMKTITVNGQQIPDPTEPNNGKLQVQGVTNPIDVTYKNLMPNATVGFRLKILWIIAFHAQATFQKYPIYSGGFGINFR